MPVRELVASLHSSVETKDGKLLSEMMRGAHLP